MFSTLFIRVMLRIIPPWTGIGFPSRLDPPPRAVTGILWVFANAMMRLTSSVVFGQMMTSGRHALWNERARALFCFSWSGREMFLYPTIFENCWSKLFPSVVFRKYCSISDYRYVWSPCNEKFPNEMTIRLLFQYFSRCLILIKIYDILSVRPAFRKLYVS